ncbi:MAG: hypothetical protein KKH32_07015 [Bacteroidetes bacterium]|nr:hypothetical protein [Bacteroidota bacterium]
MSVRHACLPNEPYSLIFVQQARFISPARLPSSTIRGGQVPENIFPKDPSDCNIVRIEIYANASPWDKYR